jgi:thiamine phosphate synthase YjbQ (UPF0047 family)
MERELILGINMKSTSHNQKPVDDAVANERGTVEHAEPMTTFEARCQTRTTEVPGFVDVTDDIVDAVARSQVSSGRATVFATDESCSIVVNERETGLLTDLKRTIARLAPANGSHPMVGSSSVVLPIVEGRLKLGTWQRVLLVELNEPSERSIDVQVVGE